MYAVFPPFSFHMYPQGCCDSPYSLGSYIFIGGQMKL